MCKLLYDTSYKFVLSLPTTSLQPNKQKIYLFSYNKKKLALSLASLLHLILIQAKIRKIAWNKGQKCIQTWFV